MQQPIVNPTLNANLEYTKYSGDITLNSIPHHTTVFITDGKLTITGTVGEGVHIIAKRADVEVNQIDTGCIICTKRGNIVAHELLGNHNTSQFILNSRNLNTISLGKKTRNAQGDIELYIAAQTSSEKKHVGVDSEKTYTGPVSSEAYIQLLQGYTKLKNSKNRSQNLEARAKQQSQTAIATGVGEFRSIEANAEGDGSRAYAQGTTVNSNNPHGYFNSSVKATASGKNAQAFAIGNHYGDLKC